MTQHANASPQKTRNSGCCFERVSFTRRLLSGRSHQFCVHLETGISEVPHTSGPGILRLTLLHLSRISTLERGAIGRRSRARRSKTADEARRVFDQVGLCSFPFLEAANLKYSTNSSSRIRGLSRVRSGNGREESLRAVVLQLLCLS